MPRPGENSLRPGKGILTSRSPPCGLDRDRAVGVVQAPQRGGSPSARRRARSAAGCRGPPAGRCGRARTSTSHGSPGVVVSDTGGVGSSAYGSGRVPASQRSASASNRSPVGVPHRQRYRRGHAVGRHKGLREHRYGVHRRVDTAGVIDRPAQRGPRGLRTVDADDHRGYCQPSPGVPPIGSGSTAPGRPPPSRLAPHARRGQQREAPDGLLEGVRDAQHGRVVELPADDHHPDGEAIRHPGGHADRPGGR